MKILIVSDFDGTINKRDIGEDLVRILDGYPDLKERFMKGKSGTPEVYKMFLNQNGVSFNVLKDFYIEQAIIDSYFPSFLKLLKKHDISHVVMSDGFDMLIKEVFNKAGIDEHICIFANSIKDNGNEITMDFPFMAKDCTLCGVCKRDIIKLFRPYFDRIIYIGNGISDICAVSEVDVVFARSILKKYCNENKIPSFWYSDYGDIITRLNKRIKGIIFDLDGTLINSFSAIYESFNYVMRSLGLSEYSYDEVLKSVGKPLEDVMAHVDGVKDVEQALKLFRANYEGIYLEKTTLMPSVKETLNGLYADGYAMAVSTNKLGKYSRILLDHLGIKKYFKSVIGIGDGSQAKPRPDTVDRILKELNLAKEEVIYVGDSLIDVDTAGNAGVGFIGTATGPTSFAELVSAKPDAVLTGFKELPAYIKTIG